MAAIVQPALAAAPANATKVNLFLECMNLPDLDLTSKSDPQVTVSLSDARGARIVGRTEIVMNNLSPKFTTPIIVDYYFEEVQGLTFEVHDVDGNSRDYLGSFHCNLGDILGSKGQVLISPLQHNRITTKKPLIKIQGEEMRGQNADIVFKLSGSHLDKKDVGLFAKSDPYLLIYKNVPNQPRTLIHRTETIKKTLDPMWNPFKLHMSVVCGGDPKLPLTVEVWDWDKHSEDDLIGICDTTLEQLLTRVPLQLIHPKKAGKRGYSNSGIVNIMAIDVIPIYSFLDYLAGGTQLNLMIGIDYTASNGNPANAGTLHFRSPGTLNQYGQAIHNVGNILLPYDYDGMIPTYGFGGRLTNGETSHCFALNGNPNQPEVPGVAGVMDVYQRSFDWVVLHGPTNFAPLIKQASTVAAQYHALAQDVSTYLLLLIITDGEITDMPETMDAIISASALPLSIVIIGVGGADFRKMDALDADGKLLTGRAGVAKRDIVQFVPYNKFNDPARLAAATLAELPGQFIDYMRQNNVIPKARIVPDMVTLVQQVETIQITTTTTAPGQPMPGPPMQ